MYYYHDKPGDGRDPAGRKGVSGTRRGTPILEAGAALWVAARLTAGGLAVLTRLAAVLPGRLTPAQLRAAGCPTPCPAALVDWGCVRVLMPDEESGHVLYELTPFGCDVLVAHEETVS